MHRIDDIEVGESLVGDLPFDECIGNHSIGLTACLKRRVRNRTHQSDVATAVDEAEITVSERLSEPFGSISVCSTSAGTRSTVDTDPVHAESHSRRAK